MTAHPKRSFVVSSICRDEKRDINLDHSTTRNNEGLKGRTFISRKPKDLKGPIGCRSSLRIELVLSSGITLLEVTHLPI